MHRDPEREIDGEEELSEDAIIRGEGGGGIAALQPGVVKCSSGESGEESV